jgi:exonuclease III
MHMPYYRPIKYIKPQKTRRRILSGLKALRMQIDEEMPHKTRDSTLILGTWNIRNFDDNRFMNGYRTSEDFYYIAEIISRFDVLAVQEICENLDPLDKIMKILDYDYDYIVTDVTEGRSGNDERLGFIFDRNKMKFKGVAGELVLPEKMLIMDEEKRRQFARTPFLCSFQSGWFKFCFSTVHIYYGESSGSKYRRRVDEIERVAKFLANRAKNDNQNHILVGDFNIVKPGSPGHNALKEHGFVIYQNNEGSNKDQTKFYDQISFRVRDNELRFVNSGRCKGVLQFFKSIYTEADFNLYEDDLKDTVKAKIVKLEEETREAVQKLSQTDSQNTKARLEKSIDSKREAITDWKSHLQNMVKLKDYYLREWRTFHGSDHLPLWVELEIDFSDNYLDYLETL